MSAERRVSKRTTKGQKPARFRSLDDVPAVTVDEARIQRRKAEAELKAAEEIAKLKQEAIQLKMEIAEKKLALETAEAEEERARSSSRSSWRGQALEELKAGEESRRSKKAMSDCDLASGALLRNKSKRGWISDGGSPVRFAGGFRPLTSLARPAKSRDRRPPVPSSDSSSSCSSGEESLSDSSVRSSTSVSSDGALVAQQFSQNVQIGGPAVVQAVPGRSMQLQSVGDAGGGVKGPTPHASQKLVSAPVSGSSLMASVGQPRPVQHAQHQGAKINLPMPTVPEHVEDTHVGPEPSSLNPGVFAFQPRRYAAPVKPLDLPRFSGTAEDYPRWRQHFRRLVHDDPSTGDVYKLAQLRECLMGGGAEELVDGILDGPGAYDAVLSELDAWYGGNDRIIERQEKEILQWPKLKEAADISSFALKLRTMLVNMGVCNVQPGRELYLSVTQKLPKYLLTSYFEKYDDNDCDVFSLAEWLLGKVHTMRRVDERLATPTGSLTNTQSVHRFSKKPGRGASHSGARAFVTPGGSSGQHTEKETCPQCGGTHQLSDCAAFAKLSVSDRWETIKKNPRVCAVCFAVGHRARACLKKACSKCNKRHNLLLHYDKTETTASDRPSSTSKQEAKTVETARTHCGQVLSDSPLPSDQQVESFMVVPVVFTSGSTHLQGTALLDPASSTSYIRQSVASSLNLAGPKKRLSTSVLGGKSASASRERVQVKLQSIDGQSATELSAWVLPAVTAPLPIVDWSEEKDKWPHLKEINFPKVRGRNVDALIGLNAVYLHSVLEEVRGTTLDVPIARRTPLGWVCLSGGDDDSRMASTMLVHNRPLDSTTSERLDELVERFWSCESAGTQSFTRETLSSDDLQAEKLTSQSIQLVDKRVEVSIPWSSPSGKPDVTSNRHQAEQRLNSLRRSLAARPEVKSRYDQVMAGHLEKGYIRRVEPEEVVADGDEQWYLPHFPVVRNDKSTTKVRIVFDGAAQWDNRSINDEMLAGPPLQNDLTKVLIRFSLEPVALVGDVSEMFLQVKLAPQDQRYHRFLWVDANGKTEVFQFTRVVFGAKASPYLASRAVKEVVKRHRQEFATEVAESLDKDLYVDDLLSSVESPGKAIEVRQQTQQLLSMGGFHMRKWLSNCPEVMKSIPPVDRSPDLTRDVNDNGPFNLPTVKTLGVSWDAERDVFTFLCQPPEIATITKRSVLRGLAKIFDPRGLISPFIIRAKVMLQDAWLLGTNWDNPLPKEQADRWRLWFEELPELRNLAIDRCFKDPKQSSSTAELTVHCFTDASDRAIAAAVYVKAAYPDGSARVTLAVSKAKPAPVKRQTIPQLELRAAVLGVRVSCIVAEALGVPVCQFLFWTDSMNVLGWVRSHSRRYKVDIGNRISEIQSVTQPQQWRHVPGKQNPADKATRGMSGSAICTDVVWHSGPEFLKQVPESWPGNKTVSSEDLPGQLKSSSRTNHSLVTPSMQAIRLSPDDFSTLERLIRVTAWCHRFILNCQTAVKTRSSTKGDSMLPFMHLDSVQIRELTPEEIDLAERFWIARAQQDVFSSVYHQLASGKDTQLSDRLAPLSPELDKSAEPWVLRVGGRLQAAKGLPRDVCSPIILPSRHRITQLIIEREDRRCSHAVGSQHLLANLRQRFWIVNGTSAVKAVRHACTTCRRNRLTPASQSMGPLPECRVSKSLRPFSRVSVDFAGPYLTKQGRSRARAKRYICVFTCLECRACHLETAYGLSTDCFLMALTRFVKRRGVPRVMVSDNGTNFRAAEEELREAVLTLDRKKIVRELVSQGIQWKFNPPRAPHFGGVVEIMVKAVKRALSATLKLAEVTDEELVTAIVQVEELVNSRPLTVMGSDPRDMAPLTPTHFLVGRLDGPLPLEVVAEEERVVDPRRRWMYLQTLVSQVWKRWLREFIPLLNVKRKWLRSRRNMVVGDIVISLTNATPRGTWPLGRVTAIYPGPDKLVRVVDVDISGKTYRRAIHQLVPLVDME